MNQPIAYLLLIALFTILYPIAGSDHADDTKGARGLPEWAAVAVICGVCVGLVVWKLKIG